MPALDLWTYIRDGGLPFLLAFIIFAGYKGWWVWGRQLQDVEHERDEWKALALKTTGLGEKALDVAQTTARRRAAP